MPESLTATVAQPEAGAVQALLDRVEVMDVAGTWSTPPRATRRGLRAMKTIQGRGIVCMASAIAASVTLNSSVGLNCTNSEPASATGTCPGDM
jgi:hypothetical protein